LGFERLARTRGSLGTRAGSRRRKIRPAVLRLIRSVADAARVAHRPLTICGEMAGDPKYIELLLGIGLRELSVAPGEMLEVKNVIRTVTLVVVRHVIGKRRWGVVGNALTPGSRRHPSFSLTLPKLSW
jgi:phosphoenolpyruvate-protein kinase (PTS system EI component)